MTRLRAALLVSAVVLCCSAGDGWAKPAAKDCSNADTQLDMNECYGVEAKQADRELNRVYQAALKRAAKDPKLTKRLRAAQRAWINFRDAELEARFPVEPGENPRELYGSVFPMCSSLAFTELTLRRVEELKHWVDGTEEGDVCAGSYGW